MPVKIFVPEPMPRVIKEKLARLEIPMADFVKCYFEAQHKAEGSETKVVSRKRESFREYVNYLETGGRRFKVVWELDWDGSSPDAVQTGIEFTEMPMKLAKNLDGGSDPQ